MGGIIKVKSEIGKGTVFLIRLMTATKSIGILSNNKRNSSTNQHDRYVEGNQESMESVPISTLSEKSAKMISDQGLLICYPQSLDQEQTKTPNFIGINEETTRNNQACFSYTKVFPYFSQNQGGSYSRTSTN
jgi:hypothetical protein